MTVSRGRIRLGPVSIFLGVLLLALLVRIVVLVQWSADPQFGRLSGDGRAYWKWADAIVAGDWLGSEVFYQAPLYPYLLGTLRTLLAVGVTEIRVVQALLGALGCAFIAMAARRLISVWAGVVAGLLQAFYPSVVSFDLQIDKTVLDTLLVPAALWGLAILKDRPTHTAAAGCGVVAGMLALSRENAMALLPLVVIWILAGVHRRHRAGRWRCAALFVGGTVLVLGPVAVRNSIIGRALILTTAQFGPNFYYGNNATADGVYTPLRPGRGDALFEREDATQIAREARGRDLSPTEISAYWTQRTLADIRSDPARWIRLMGRKLAMTFAATELPDSDVHDRIIVYSSLLNGLDRLMGMTVLLPLSAAGWALLWGRWRRLWILPAMIATLAATTALFIHYERYRLAMICMMFPLAAVPIAVAIESVRRRRGWRMCCRWTGAAVAAALGFGLVLLGEHAIPTRACGTNHHNRAKIWFARGDQRRAEQLYRQAIAANPLLAESWCNLGLILIDQKNYEEAKSVLVRALQIEPNDVASQVNLGIVAFAQGDIEAAAAAFKRALEIDPANDIAKRNFERLEQMRGR